VKAAAAGKPTRAHARVLTKTNMHTNASVHVTRVICDVTNMISPHRHIAEDNNIQKRIWVVVVGVCVTSSACTTNGVDRMYVRARRDDADDVTRTNTLPPDHCDFSLLIMMVIIKKYCCVDLMEIS